MGFIFTDIAPTEGLFMFLVKTAHNVQAFRTTLCMFAIFQCHFAWNLPMKYFPYFLLMREIKKYEKLVLVLEIANICIYMFISFQCTHCTFIIQCHSKIITRWLESARYVALKLCWSKWSNVVQHDPLTLNWGNEAAVLSDKKFPFCAFFPFLFFLL